MRQFPGIWILSKCFKKAVSLFDGGFTFGGLTGNGIGFVVRDAHGIRPCYYYVNDDVIVAASERAAIRTAFNVGENEVQELMPGQCTDCRCRMAISVLSKLLNQRKEKPAVLNVSIFRVEVMKKSIRKERRWDIILSEAVLKGD